MFGPTALGKFSLYSALVEVFLPRIQTSATPTQTVPTPNPHSIGTISRQYFLVSPGMMGLSRQVEAHNTQIPLELPIKTLPAASSTKFEYYLHKRDPRG